MDLNFVGDFFRAVWPVSSADWAAWVTGVATTAAFIFSVGQLSRQRKLNREDGKQRRLDARRAQASQVTAWFDRASNSIHVRNSSDAVIYDVFAVLLLNEPDERGSSRSGADGFSHLMRVVPPKATARALVAPGWAGMNAVPYAKITFRDANGVTWTRGTSGSLHEDNADVFKKYGLSRPWPYYEPAML